MLKTSDIPSLADLVVELASWALLIGKVIKEESISVISSVEFERLKKKVSELGKRLGSLATQVKELSKSKRNR